MRASNGSSTSSASDLSERVSSMRGRPGRGRRGSLEATLTAPSGWGRTVSHKDGPGKEHANRPHIRRAGGGLLRRCRDPPRRVRARPSCGRPGCVRVGLRSSRRGPDCLELQALSRSMRRPTRRGGPFPEIHLGDLDLRIHQTANPPGVAQTRANTAIRWSNRRVTRRPFLVRTR